MDYRDRIRATVGKDSTCLEIGPSYGPILPKKQGFKTTVFDHLSKEELVEKYKNHKVNSHLIEDVDILGTALDDVDAKFDAIVASHVIEHTPDMIGFLQQCSRLMHAGSQLFLITPDKRRVFDAMRPLSTTGNVIDAHLLKRTRHVGAIFDTKIHAVSRRGKNLWSSDEDAPMNTIHNFAEAKALLRDVMSVDHYVDTHAWCFTPQSFRLIMFDLMGLEFIDLIEDEYYDHERTEFYFVLRKGRLDESLISQRRAQLAEAADKALKEFEAVIRQAPFHVRR
ncbi:class I SAM-dependent methyltransferase [Agrobacterium pusense]|uniref:class I SAM-dependent methyltransferase n=1 Tax=Agrobacterium pusense TaxID=648995 RepID=UPI002FDE5641